MPIRFTPKLGFFVEERGQLGEIDLRVKKPRGCQGYPHVLGPKRWVIINWLQPKLRQFMILTSVARSGS